jgi:hypothetical protein
VKDRDLLALGGDGRQTTIRITQDQDCIRLHLPQQRVRTGNDIADCLGRSRSGCIQEIVGLADFQIFKKDLI